MKRKHMISSKAREIIESAISLHRDYIDYWIDQRADIIPYNEPGLHELNQGINELNKFRDRFIEHEKSWVYSSVWPPNPPERKDMEEDDMMSELSKKARVITDDTPREILVWRIGELCNTIDKLGCRDEYLNNYSVISTHHSCKFFAVGHGTKEYCVGYCKGTSGQYFVVCGKFVVWPEERYGELVDGEIE